MPIRLTVKEAARLGLDKKKRTVKRRLKTWAAHYKDRQIWISIPELPPSLNEWSRRHWSYRDRQVAEMTRNLAILKRVNNIPVMEKPRVQLVYYFATNQRRDPDNYAGKFLLDGLRHAGIISEDNARVLQLPQPEFKVDRDQPRTDIFITEWRE